MGDLILTTPVPPTLEIAKNAPVASTLQVENL